jgi:hypothetical protein
MMPSARAFNVALSIEQRPIMLVASRLEPRSDIARLLAEIAHRSGDRLAVAFLRRASGAGEKLVDPAGDALLAELAWPLEIFQEIHDHALFERRLIVMECIALAGFDWPCDRPCFERPAS